MTESRLLIVNADDFGRSRGINQGILQAHDLGIVTSTSLMVCWPDAEDAVEAARSRPSLSLGLHLDLGEWSFVNDRWLAAYSRADLDRPAEVAAEVARQMALFREMVGRMPTHVDSHQHTHKRETVRPIVIDAAGDDIPVRGFSPLVRHCGDFYGQMADATPFPDGISVNNLVRLLDALPSGVTELGCHPGFVAEKEDQYASERAIEVATLCDHVVIEAVRRMNITLVSFAQLDSLTP